MLQRVAGSVPGSNGSDAEGKGSLDSPLTAGREGGSGTDPDGMSLMASMLLLRPASRDGGRSTDIDGNSLVSKLPVVGHVPCVRGPAAAGRDGGSGTDMVSPPSLVPGLRPLHDGLINAPMFCRMIPGRMENIGAEMGTMVAGGSTTVTSPLSNGDATSGAGAIAAVARGPRGHKPSLSPEFVGELAMPGALHWLPLLGAALIVGVSGGVCVNPHRIPPRSVKCRTAFAAAAFRFRVGVNGPSPPAFVVAAAAAVEAALPVPVKPRTSVTAEGGEEFVVPGTGCEEVPLDQPAPAVLALEADPNKAVGLLWARKRCLGDSVMQGDGSQSAALSGLCDAEHGALLGVELRVVSAASGRPR
jgi:hypothetical protein